MDRELAPVDSARGGQDRVRGQGEQPHLDRRPQRHPPQPHELGGLDADPRGGLLPEGVHVLSVGPEGPAQRGRGRGRLQVGEQRGDPVAAEHVDRRVEGPPAAREACGRHEQLRPVGREPVHVGCHGGVRQVREADAPVDQDDGLGRDLPMADPALAEQRQRVPGAAEDPVVEEAGFQGRQRSCVAPQHQQRVVGGCRRRGHDLVGRQPRVAGEQGHERLVLGHLEAAQADRRAPCPGTRRAATDRATSWVS